MHAIAIRNQIGYLALARRQQRAAENLTFEEGIQTRAKKSGTKTNNSVRRHESNVNQPLLAWCW